MRSRRRFGNMYFLTRTVALRNLTCRGPGSKPKKGIMIGALYKTTRNLGLIKASSLASHFTVHRPTRDNYTEERAPVLIMFCRRWIRLAAHTLGSPRLCIGRQDTRIITKISLQLRSGVLKMSRG